jgi:polyisoprenyl-teichoic acid--peptidoglycan teichoic acid transferase
VNPPPPRERKGMFGRFVLGSLILLVLAGATAATAGFEEVRDITSAFSLNKEIQTDENDITLPEAGDPQTILLLGSDQRSAASTDPLAGGARSDTMMLIRLNPKADSISVMNVPRDLLVDIPGYGRDKINASYSSGGPKLTLKTIKQLLSTPDRPFKINHVIDVKFSGFQDIIDSINCVFLDIDRRYFNENPAYADIDIQPGYQKVCGYNALEYARFREEDTDLVRAARQQDVLREAKAQVKSSSLISKRRKLLRIFGSYSRSDKGLRKSSQVIRLLKLALFSANKPVNQVQFPAIISPDPKDTYLRFKQDELDKAVKAFLDGKASVSGNPQLKPTDAEKAEKRRRRRDKGGRGANVEDSGTAGEDQAVAIATEVPYPVYFPQMRTPGSVYIDTPRVYPIKRGKNTYTSYRMVLKQGGIGEYYGVQGTSWLNPPILSEPHEDRKIGNRTFQLYYDGRRIRLVAWKTDKAVYWITNTLTSSISNKEMLGMARSFRKLG